MNQLSCVILDDEPAAADLVELMVQACTTWKIVAKCYHPAEAAAVLQQQEADIIFLDIGLPGINGLEFAGSLPKSTAVVFVTAYQVYAAESYNVAALDYLVKPVTMYRFLIAKIRIECWFCSRQGKIGPGSKDDAYYFVGKGKDLYRVLLDDILYFVAHREHVTVVTPENEVTMIRRLKEVESQLESPFVRIHQSYIVNTKNLSKIQDNHVYIGRIQIPIGGKFRERFFTEIRRRLF